MKKSIILLTAVFAALYSSCGLIDFSNDKVEVSAPVATSTNGVVALAILPRPNYDYVNVIRYEVEDDTSNAGIKKDTTFTIGQIVPQVSEKTGKLYDGALVFNDYYTNSGSYYQYYVQYKTSSGYVKSNTTQTVAGVGSGELEVTADTTPLLVDYHSVTGNLTIDKSYFTTFETLETHYSEPGKEEYFTLMVALSNGIKTQLFEMSLETTDYTVALKSRLPDNFIKRPLTIQGFVGAHEDPKLGSYLSIEFYNFKNYCWIKPYNGEIDLNVDDEGSDFFVVENVKDEKDTFDYLID